MKIVAFALALLATGAATAQTPVYSISTAAGGSTAADFVEGGSASSFLIPGFWTPAIDKQGNFYFIMDQRVVKAGPDGTATNYAGTGVAGYNGDGGPAASAQLDTPGALLFDPKGRLLILDTYHAGSNRIRRVETDGTISTIAGTGEAPTTPTEGDGHLATSARVHATQGAFDKAGNLYILDLADHFNIRRIDPNGFITTVARNVGIFPTGLACDGTTLYLVDVNGGVNRVTRVNPDGTLFTVAGGIPTGFGGDGGPSVNSKLAYPNSIATDSAGNVHIVDGGNNRIRTIFNTATTPASSGRATIFTTAGTGVQGFGGDGDPAVTSMLSGAAYIASDALDNLYVSDSGSGRFRRYRLNGTFESVAGLVHSDPLGDGGPATQAVLLAPSAPFFDAAGNLLFDDGSKVRMVAPDGTISTIAGQGTQGETGDRGDGPATAALLSYPRGAVRDSFGNVFVLDANILRKISPDGTITRISGFPGATKDEGAVAEVNLGAGQSLTIDSQDNVYIASYLAVRKLTGSVVTRVFGTNGYVASNLSSGPARSAAVLSLYGIAVDAAGNLAVDDWANHRILRVTPDGQFTTLVGTYQKPGFTGDSGPASTALINHPTGGAFDAWGNYYFLDQGNSRLRRIRVDGTINTIAGLGTPGSDGDGGAALSAQLGAVFSIGIAADLAGNIFFADGNRIRQLTPDKLKADGVLHAATSAAGPVVAGLRIFIRGPELIPPNATSDQIQVLFDGQPAGFVSTDGSQIVTVVPGAVAGQATTQMQVQFGTALTNSLAVPVVAALPGILGIENADGTLNGGSSPASPGSMVVLLVTGDGNIDPSLLSVQIGDGVAAILDVSPSDTTPGVRRVTIQLPDGVPDGAAVVVWAGDIQSTGSVVIRVQ